MNDDKNPKTNISTYVIISVIVFCSPISCFCWIVVLPYLLNRVASGKCITICFSCGILDSLVCMCSWKSNEFSVTIHILCVRFHNKDTLTDTFSFPSLHLHFNVILDIFITNPYRLAHTVARVSLLVEPFLEILDDMSILLLKCQSHHIHLFKYLCTIHRIASIMQPQTNNAIIL